MEHVRVAYITAPAEDAEKLAQGIVENRLAACVNVVPGVKSFYWWDDEIKHEAESMLMVKTTQLKIEALIGYVKEHHPYEVPEVITFKMAEGMPDYLDWVIEETGKK